MPYSYPAPQRHAGLMGQDQQQSAYLQGIRQPNAYAQQFNYGAGAGGPQAGAQPQVPRGMQVPQGPPQETRYSSSQGMAGGGTVAGQMAPPPPVPPGTRSMGGRSYDWTGAEVDSGRGGGIPGNSGLTMEQHLARRGQVITPQQVDANRAAFLQRANAPPTEAQRGLIAAEQARVAQIQARPGYGQHGTYGNQALMNRIPAQARGGNVPSIATPEQQASFAAQRAAAGPMFAARTGAAQQALARRITR